MSDWNNTAQNLNGTGLFALNINSSGVSGHITAGGTNIGSSLYDIGKGFTIDMATRNYASKHQESGADLMRDGYAIGDKSFENTIWRLLAGKDSLSFDSEDGQAQTIKKISGGRAIHMDESFADLTDDEFITALSRLQHEAHRDGVINSNNTAERSAAVNCSYRDSLKSIECLLRKIRCNRFRSAR